MNASHPVRLYHLIGGLALVVAAFDCCFWKVDALGLAVPVFFAVFAGVILFNRSSVPRRHLTRLLLGLCAGAILAGLIETGFTNTVVFLLLIVVLAGDTYFQGIESSWGRWLSTLGALVFAPGRFFWLSGILMRSAFAEGLGLIGGLILAVPALVLALVFGWLLASGNAVFGQWTGDFFNWIWKELGLVLDPWRISLWVLVALVALPLLRPADVSARWWGWTQRLPRLPALLPPRAATFSSGLILVVLNFLFLLANGADALFLWSGQALPPGITYSAFVHHGVDSLLVTTILSAFVLTFIFQQEAGVTGRRALRIPAFAWIAQNLFLLLSVGLRLKQYIEAYDMTVLRLGLIIFLVLVATGYVLLTIKILWDKSLSWLVAGGILAIFATLYIAQFLNLAGWSANYNVARWEKDPTRKLDCLYLGELGPAAWPALRRAYEFKGGPNSTVDRNYLVTLEVSAAVPTRTLLDGTHWRDFSLRAWGNRWALERPNN